MKRILYSILAAAALFTLGSCVRETEKGAGDTFAHVTFNFELDGLSTKAWGDGSGINELYVGVYDANSGEYIAQASAEKVSFSGHGASYSASLIKGRSYRISFFAQKAGNALYTVDLKDKKTIVANYGNVPCNTDDYDCFYHLERLNNLSENISKPITLTRPLAQINLLTSEQDVESAAVLGYKPGTSKMSIYKAPNTLNLVDGSLSNEADVVFTEAPCTEPSFVDGYQYISMAYIFVNEGANETKTVTMNVNLEGIEDPSLSSTNMFQLPDVPVKRNYRTNIMGRVFTADAVFTLDVASGFGGTNNVSILPSVKPISFTPASGATVKVGDKVTAITTETEDATIYYNTVKDQQATTDDTVFAEFEITEAMVTDGKVYVNAIAVKDGFSDAYATAEYTIDSGTSGGGGDEPEEVDFTSNVEFTTINAAYTDNKLNITYGSDTFTDVANVKVGTSKIPGSFSVQLPAGTTKVTFWAVGWKGKDAPISITVGDKAYPDVTATANDGASGNSPYTVTVTDDDKFVVDLDAALAAETTMTFSTSNSGLRAFVFGIVASNGSSSSAGIKIDGKFDDWANIEAIPGRTGGSIKEWKYANDKDNLYFYFKIVRSDIIAAKKEDPEGSGIYPFNWRRYIYIGIDTDNNATTPSADVPYKGEMEITGCEVLALVFPFRGNATSASGTDGAEVVNGVDTQGWIEFNSNPTGNTLTAYGVIDEEYGYLEVSMPMEGITPATGTMKVQFSLSSNLSDIGEMVIK